MSEIYETVHPYKGRKKTIKDNSLEVKVTKKEYEKGRKTIWVNFLRSVNYSTKSKDHDVNLRKAQRQKENFRRVQIGITCGKGDLGNYY